MSSAVSKLPPPGPHRSLPKEIQAKSTLPAGGERALPSFHHAFDLQENASSDYTFNINAELATSKGKQLPTATFLLYSFVMGGVEGWFLGKKKQTSFSSVSQEECKVNHRLFPSKFVVSSLAV